MSAVILDVAFFIFLQARFRPPGNILYLGESSIRHGFNSPCGVIATWDDPTPQLKSVLFFALDFRRRIPGDLSNFQKTFSLISRDIDMVPGIRSGGERVCYPAGAGHLLNGRIFQSVGSLLGFLLIRRS